MENDKLFISRVKQFSKGLLYKLAIKLENNDLEITSDNIIYVLNEVELDNIDYILLAEYKYWFVKRIKTNIIIIE